MKKLNGSGYAGHKGFTKQMGAYLDDFQDKMTRHSCDAMGLLLQHFSNAPKVHFPRNTRRDGIRFFNKPSHLMIVFPVALD
ncbi:hypothetical protein FACS1894204_13000 [Synergistales bacterium]|nr:hypothetical protein FACS1894204_13000 [Synergistales bacterium]